MKTENKGLIGASVLSAIAASLCCITPVLALVAGSSGLAYTYGWREPFWPLFTGNYCSSPGLCLVSKNKTKAIN